MEGKFYTSTEASDVPEEKMTRLMLLPTRSPEQPLQLAEFDKQVALEALCNGQTVIPFWSDACGELC